MTPDPDPMAEQLRKVEQTVQDWANGGTRNQIAAHIARQILTARLLPYFPLPSNQSLADDWNTSTSTVVRAKALLAEHRWITKRDGTYRVT